MKVFSLESFPLYGIWCVWEWLQVSNHAPDKTNTWLTTASYVVNCGFRSLVRVIKAPLLPIWSLWQQKSVHTHLIWHLKSTMHMSPAPLMEGVLELHSWLDFMFTIMHYITLHHILWLYSHHVILSSCHALDFSVLHIIINFLAAGWPISINNV